MTVRAKVQSIEPRPAKAVPRNGHGRFTGPEPVARRAAVLEPEWLREDMANNAYWMSRMYARPSLPPDGAPDPDRS